MNNNKQQPKPENPNNQFSNTEPLTHAQRVAIANKMSNNKQSMKLYTEEDLIDLVESLKHYTHEAHSILGHDERDAKEFVDIFLKDRTPIELPSDEEIEQEMNNEYPLTGHVGIDHRNYLRKVGYIQGAKYVINKIQGGNNEQQ